MIATALIIISAIHAQPSELDTFLADFEKSREKVENFRARFIQVVESPGDTFRSAGTVVFTKPRLLIYRTEDMVTVVDGGTSYEYEKDLEQVLVDDIAGTPFEDLFFFGFDADTRELRSRYDLRVFEEPEDPIGKRRLAIRPKPNEKEAAPFVEVVISFRDEDFLPHNIRVQNDEDGSTTYILNSYELNAKLSPPECELVLPPGTIIIKRGEVVEEVGEGGRRIPTPVIARDPTLPSRLRDSAPAAAE